MQKAKHRPETFSLHTAAILGCACRLPGAPNEASFWSLIDSGRCSVSEIPKDRWSHDRYFHPKRGVPGRSYTFAAGVIDDIASFDPGAFGLSLREAEQIDPQQRLLLELVREALEDANIPFDRLSDERVGVFVGASSLDHSMYFAADIAAADSHFVTGNAMSIIANRISHIFDFTGPSLTIDTACSSSLVAFDRAVKAIEAGEIDLAIVAGVNILLNPFYFVGFARAGMLSPTGLCRPFSAEADGYVRSEGGVVTILSRLDKAKSAGRTPRAVVRASGTNSDGHTVGIAMPARLGQQRLLDELYRVRGIDPSDLAFVEAHGTGTLVGDPAEAYALGVALGQRRKLPLPIGSVKSNIGHLEPASGLAGMLKALNALEKGRLPPSLHLDTPNETIDFDELNLVPASKTVDLSQNGARSAAISSFGFGGTNAHVVIRLPEPDECPIPVRASAQILMISATDPRGLVSLAGQYADRMEAVSDTADAARVAHAVAYGRARQPYRLAVAVSDPQAASKLRQAAATDAAVSLTTGGGEFAFVFSGNGAQYPGMGHAAWKASQPFREIIAQIDYHFAPLSGWSLSEMFVNPPDANRLAATEIAQPLIFALEVGLARSLMENGCKPSIVFGHSVGEVAAAYVAGILSLEEAVHLIYWRSQLQAQLYGHGTMAVLLTDSGRAQEFIDVSAQNEVFIAAINAPNAVTLSGSRDGISAVLHYARRQRIVGKRLDIEYPFHAPAVEPLKAPIRTKLATLTPRDGDIPFVSTVTGEIIDGRRLDSEYWWRNIREPVQFERATCTAAATRTRLFVEIGPRPVLTGFLRETLAEEGDSAAVLASFQAKDRLDEDPVTRTMLTMLTHGVQFDDDALFGASSPVGRVDLPVTPWNRLKIAIPHTREAIDLFGQCSHPHPLLGARLSEDSLEWKGLIDIDRLAFLADHKVGDNVLVPATALAEMLLAAGREALGECCLQMENFSIFGALRLDPGESTETLVRMDGEGFITLSARTRGTGEWSLKAQARLLAAPRLSTHVSFNGEQGTPVTADALYASAAQLGLHYGPAFRLVKIAHRLGSRISLDFVPAVTQEDYVLSPTYADASLHGLVLGVESVMSERACTFVPIRIERLIVQTDRTPARAVLEIRRSSERSLLLDVDILDNENMLIARMEGVRLRAISLVSDADLESDFVQIAVPVGRTDSQAGDKLQMAMNAIPASTVSDDTLLLDACAYAIAHRAVVATADLNGEGWQKIDVPSLIQSGQLAAEKRDQFIDLLHLLAEGTLARSSAEDGWSIAVASDLPSPEVILTDILAHSADRVAEVTLAARLAADLQASLREINPITYPPALIELWEATSPNAQEIGRSTALLASTLLEEEQSVPSVLVVEKHGILMEALRPLAESGKLHLFVRPVDPEARTRLVSRLSGSRLIRLVDDKEILPVDLVVSTVAVEQNNKTSSPVKPGGAHLCVQSARTGFAALLAAGSPWAVLSGQRLNRARGAVDVVLQRAQATAEESPAGIAAAIDQLLESNASTLLISTKGAFPEPSEVDIANAHKSDIIVYQFDRADDSKGIGENLDNARWLLETIRNVQEPPSVRFLIEGDPLGPFPQATALWAFGRVAINEYPDLDIRLLALAGHKRSGDSSLARAVVGIADEMELILINEELKAVRLQPRELQSSDSSDTGCARLVNEHPGALDRLAWRNFPRRSPAKGEIEIGVAAGALNFRDVMFAQGLISDDMLENGFAGSCLGFECAGTVLRVGEGVTTLKPGDVVAAFAPNALASHVTVSAEAVLPVPEGTGAEAAATLLVAFLTAWYGLVHCARLSAGETVLVHGAAGGVGLAALQIARARGARIIATAGTPEKRALVRLLGADAVYSSRELAFSDALARDGGCDVVLNSLAGRAMEESLKVLKPFGRFIELGKRDFIADTRLGLRPFARNLTYFGVDADQLIAAQPDLVRKLMNELSEQFSAGLLIPLPYEAISADNVHGAFRLMQSSGHVGKIIIRPPVSRPLSDSSVVFTASGEGVHLVVGGGTGFGRATAEWLARSGARRIVIASRQGRVDPPLNIDGVTIETKVCDVRDARQCTNLIEDLRQRHGRVAGVVHAAMVLDDALLRDTNADRLAAVLGPKIDGANNLDAATATLDLDYFVLFSSATTLVGNPGQAAYVAANAYLEGLARRRRAQGRTALAVAWGAISDAGVLARDSNTSEKLRNRLSLAMLTAKDALGKLGNYLADKEDDAVRSCAPINWRRANELAVTRGASFSLLRSKIEENEIATGNTSIAELISGQSDREAKATLVMILSGELGRILRLPGSSVDPSRPLVDLGMDSLMALELDMEVQSRYAISLPLLGLGAGVTLLDVVDKVLHRLRDTDDDEETDELINEGAALIETHVGSEIDESTMGHLQQRVATARQQTGGRR